MAAHRLSQKHREIYVFVRVRVQFRLAYLHLNKLLCSADLSRRHYPRRPLLYVPGEEKKQRKTNAKEKREIKKK